MLNVVLALVLVYTPRVARVVRASTLVVRELLFVEAARARRRVAPPRILWRHILPNLMSPILVQGSFIFAYAILAEAALSFLGVGVPPEIPTWGTMVAGSQQYAHQALWIVLFPGPRDHRSPRCRCNCWATASATCSIRGCASRCDATAHRTASTCATSAPRSPPTTAWSTRSPTSASRSAPARPPRWWANRARASR